MNVVGLDLSLTSTGVALTDGSVMTSTKVTSATGPQRLIDLRDWALDCCRLPMSGFYADLVAVEGYSMGTARQSSHAHALGELGGVVRVALFEWGLTWVDVAPASLKKYATGKGNAGKDEVYGEAIRRLGYTGKSKDEADALWLRAMALDHYGEPVVSMPAVNRSALAGVAWPALTLAVDTGLDKAAVTVGRDDS